MDLELNDKVAVVTGAGKGIGLAATRALVAEGAEVIAGFRKPPTSTGSRASPAWPWISPLLTARGGWFSARSTSTAELTFW